MKKEALSVRKPIYIRKFLEHHNLNPPIYDCSFEDLGLSELAGSEYLKDYPLLNIIEKIHRTKVAVRLALDLG